MRVAALLLLAALLAPAIAPPPVAIGQTETAARAPTADELAALSADEFFARPEVREPLERDAIDLVRLDVAVFHATNQVRAEHRLPPLRYHNLLARAAEMHARSMLEHGYLAHENPHDDALRTPMHRVRAAGYQPRTVSENLAQVFRLRYEAGKPYYRFERDGRTLFSYEPSPDGEPIPPHTYESLARELVKEWMNSPGHRENILRRASEELGIAVRFRFKSDDLDEALGVQVFASPMRGR